MIEAFQRKAQPTYPWCSGRLVCGRPAVVSGECDLVSLQQWRWVRRKERSNVGRMQVGATARGGRALKSLGFS